MTAPLDLDALEAAARGEPSCVATWCAIGMSSTILELIRRLRAAEAEIEVERCLSFRSQVAELEAALAESRKNDRTAMGYLSAIRDALGHDGDYPSLVENLKEMSGVQS